MAAVAELIRTEADGKISFGNHLLQEKSKKEGFEAGGDEYKVKTFKEITKLERNGMFVYESVPGTSVEHFAESENGVSFTVEGTEDAQITLGLEEDTEYDVKINGEDAGRMRTNLGGKLNVSVELAGIGEVKVEISKYIATKIKTRFFCQECGYETAKWLGQCPGCKAWNSLVEEPVSVSAGGKEKKQVLSGVQSAPAVLNEISMEEERRTETGMGELDRVLGGGIVTGSLTLVGGDPGIGKSTLLLQMCRNLSLKKQHILYVSGEESLRQIKMRAMRIGDFSDTLELFCETNLNRIEEIIQQKKPQIVIIDSIQTMYNEAVSAAPGSVSQVRESTGVLLRLAKGLGISIFIVGHVTKEGTVAGPRVLEHMVDTVLYFEGDRHASYRSLRGVKNRFGSTDEIGVFEMRQEGLTEVLNPSEFMLNGRPAGASGSVVSCSMEGTRPMLTEIQALVCHSNFGIPRRQTTGTDFNRVNLLMAVLEKRLGMQIGGCDAYVNLAGGIRITEPAIDLGIVMAIMSSFKNSPVPEGVVAFGEVGLSGEVRAVSMAEQRVREAQKLGFTTCILPQVCLEKMPKISGIRLVGVRSVADAAREL